MASRYKKADTPEEHSLPFYTGRSRIIIRRAKTGHGPVSGKVSVALVVAWLKSPVREYFHLHLIYCPSIIEHRYYKH